MRQHDLNFTQLAAYVFRLVLLGSSVVPFVVETIIISEPVRGGQITSASNRFATERHPDSIYSNQKDGVLSLHSVLQSLFR